MNFVIDAPHSSKPFVESVVRALEQTGQYLSERITDDVHLTMVVFDGTEEASSVIKEKYGFSAWEMMLDVVGHGEGRYTAVFPAHNVYRHYFYRDESRDSEEEYRRFFDVFVLKRFRTMFPYIIRDREIPSLSSPDDYMRCIRVYPDAETGWDLPFPPEGIGAVALDIETEGLEFNAKITSISAAWYHDNRFFGFAAPAKPMLEWLISLAGNDDYASTTFVFHNASFDLPRILYRLVKDHNVPWDFLRERFHGKRTIHDTMCFQQVWENSSLLNMRAGLGRVAHVLLGANPKETFRTEEVKRAFKKNCQQMDFLDVIFQKHLLVYNASDALATIGVYFKMKARYGHLPRFGDTMHFLQQYHKILCEMMARGLPVCKKTLLTLKTQYEILVEEALADVQKHPFIASSKDPINVASPTQLLKVFQAQGIEIKSTDESELSRIRGDGQDFAQAILTFRKYSKVLSTYILPTLEQSSIDGYIHPSYSVSKTRTYRLSSESPNIQNFPSEGNLRGMIVAPPGQLVLSVDYKQLEVCVLGALSNDPALLESLEKGTDIHREWAERVFDMFPDSFQTYRQEPREKAIQEIRSHVIKMAWTFALFYGAGIKTVCSGLGVDPSDPETKDKVLYLIDQFWARYAGVKAWQKRVVGNYQQNQVSVYPTGFVRHARLRYTEIINGVIQSVGASVTNATMIRLYERACAEHREELFPRITIHDELVFFVPEDRAQDVKAEIEREFSEAPKRFPFLSSVRFVGKGTLSKEWSK